MDMIRIAIVGDNPLARAGLAAMLENEDSCLVLGQAAVDEALYTQLDVLAPDVVIWDIGWNFDAAQWSFINDVDYLFIGLIADESHVGKLWSLGVSGLLDRATEPEAIVQALQVVNLGMTVIDNAYMEQLNTITTSAESLDEPLTARESEVLQLLAEGLSNKGIGYQLGISDHTVKFHVNAIMTKLNAQSRTEAAVRATKLGLLRL